MIKIQFDFAIDAMTVLFSVPKAESKAENYIYFRQKDEHFEKYFSIKSAST